MKILVVTPHSPWPEDRGVAIRIANTIRGLARVGEVDLLIIADGDWEPYPANPADVSVRRLNMVVAHATAPSMIRRVAWLVRGPLPKQFLGRDYRGARAAYGSWNAEPYDVAWLFRIQGFVALARCLQAPTIVDLDELEDYKIEARLALEAVPENHERAGVASRLRRAAVDLQARRDAKWLRALHAQIARSVEGVVVCNELDRWRLGAKNVHVIPNGYAYQHQPVGRPTIGHPPVVTFLGLLTYRPNADGATRLVREIAPWIRERIPEVQIRLVGEPTPEIEQLHDPPRVSVTGFVQDIRTELAIADVLAVPIRYGGGTRIKILEAFAHRIPVVSTTPGAEGIEVIDGRDIFLADTARAFAEACVRLLSDPELRRRMVDAAHHVFVNKYCGDRIQEMVASLAVGTARLVSQPAERRQSRGNRT